MKKNVIFWCGIKNQAHNDKYGNFEYFEYTKATWQYFCKRFNCEFVEFNEPVQEDLFEYRVNWQKAIYVFDVLDKKQIEYDQIALVDSTCMYKWDAPNFFALTDHKFTAFRDSDNLNWIHQSVQGYKEFFENFEFDLTRYVNSGFIIFNETHRAFFESFRQLYLDNKQYFIDAQDKIVKKGTEQTPLNYWLQIQRIDVNMNLPLPFKLTHMNRKDLFSHNWQLTGNTTSFFMKYGYNWIFNGIPKDDRSRVIALIWQEIGHNYDDKYLILDQVNHKNTHKNSTTRKFKQDLIDYFNGSKINNCVEFGSCHGDTTRVLSTFCNTVYASDLHPSNVAETQTKCSQCDNVHCVQLDVNDAWHYDAVDLIFPDALHDYHSIKRILQRIQQQYQTAVIVMDDYGHEMNTVKPVIDELIANDKIQVLAWIGEDVGYRAANGKLFVGREGLIFKFQ